LLANRPARERRSAGRPGPWLLLCLLAPWLAAAAGTGRLPSPSSVLVSHSGQFLVSQPFPVKLPADLLAVSTNAGFLRVEPALLLVTCERVRQRLAQELGGLPPGRDRIHLTVIPARTPTDPLTLLAERHPGGWTYRLAVPEVVQQRRLLEGLVQVVFLEVANRSAGEWSTDLPAWLVAGWAGRLLALAGEELLFAPPSGSGPLAVRRTVVERRRYDPLRGVRPVLERHGVLSWQQLCWPGSSGNPGAETEVFRASAELLVHELLRLPSGPAPMTAFILGRAQYLNWQTAFLAAYARQFQRMLDVEKWWALQVASFRPDPTAPGAPGSAGAWASLREAVRVPVEVRPSPDELPAARTNWPLQEVIRRWDWSRQRPALEACMARLQTVAATLPAEAQLLARAYIQTLARYLEQRPRADASVPASGLVRPTPARLVYETLGRLDQLDTELEANLARAGQARPGPLPARASAARVVTNDLGTLTGPPEGGASVPR